MHILASRNAIGNPEIKDAIKRHEMLKSKLEHYLRSRNATVTEGHTGQQRFQHEMYIRLASMPFVKTVCEIGFNAGHSSTAWLILPRVRLISFDWGEHDYGCTARKFFRDEYPERIIHVLGDSKKTVPGFPFEQVCDLIVVDGGHDFETAINDIRNMKRLANPSCNVFIIDDTPCTADHCIGPNKATEVAVQEQLIEILFEHKDAVINENLNYRGFKVGMYRE